MKSVKFEVTRAYIAFGYYLEWYKSVDGGRANSGLTELWLGKDDMDFKEFVIQADFSDESDFGMDYIMQNTFAGAIMHYNEKYAMEEEEALAIREHNIGEITYEVTRYYLRDNYYFDVDRLSLFEDDEDSLLENITIGKINCLSKATLCCFDAKDGGIGNESDDVFNEILEAIAEPIDLLFIDNEEESMDLDIMAEDELASEHNLYYKLTADSYTVSDETDDEITFDV